MKRCVVCLSLVALTTTAAAAVTTEKPDAHAAARAAAKPAVHARAIKTPVKVAPADEYFGKLKLSILGIRNTIKDVGANIDIDQARWQQQSGKAFFAEDAMRDWERKYPNDTWLAKTVFSLERMYSKLLTDEGRQRSVATMKWLVHDWPKSWYGRTGKRELAEGKVGTQAVAARPSPSPQEVADPAASAAPIVPAADAGRVAPAASAAPATLPVPVADPSASPAPTHSQP